MSTIQHVRLAEILPHRQASALHRFEPGTTTLQRGLLGGAALGALFLAMSGPAMAACMPSGGTITCTGDQSAGVSVTNPYDTLDVNNLNANIAPTLGTDGISFEGDGPLSLVSDTGTFSVVTSGSGGDGISMTSHDGGDIAIDHTGHIDSAAGQGIFATTQGSIDATTSGEIDADLDAIHLAGVLTGDITVEHTGNLTSTTGVGLWADTQGDVDVTINGNIDAGTIGIHARSGSSDPSTVTVSHTGDITSRNGAGIDARAPNGSVSVTNTGTIDATGDGIAAQNATNLAVNVDQTGLITATGRGIYAYSSSGTVNVTATGTIRSGGIGVLAQSNGSTASIHQTGDITSSADRGIVADAPSGGASVTGSGAVTAAGDAISATGTGPAGTVVINRSGTVKSTAGRGIVAYGAGTGVTVTNSGTISAHATAVDAQAVGSGTNLSITQTGDVTSTTGEGIFAHATTGNVTLTTAGTISAQGRAIDAQSSGPGSAVTITQTGDLSSTDDVGLWAKAAAGPLTITVHGAVSGRLGAISAAGGSVDITSTGKLSSDGTALDAEATGDGGAAVVTQTGDVTSTGGEGIVAHSAAGSAGVTSTGTILAKGTAIDVQATGPGGTATVAQAGSLTSTDGEGIYAHAADGAASVGGTGTITSKLTGVDVLAQGGAASVDQTGDIASSAGGGIVIKAPAGSATLSGGGKVTAHDDAIFLDSRGDGSPTGVDRAGDIISTAGRGIYAHGSAGAVDMTNTGTISAYDTGIYVQSEGEIAAANVWQSGTVTSTTGSGIWDQAAQGPVSVHVWGNVNATADDAYGIHASNAGAGAVTVEAHGNIDARNGIGIYAFSPNGAVTVTSTGIILARKDGIYAANTGSGTSINVYSSNDVTSTTADGIYAGSDEINGHQNASLTNVESTGNVSGAVNGVHVNGTVDLGVTNHGGTIEGGSGAGVYFEGGGDNHLVNYGTIDNRTGIEGTAIASSSSNTAIDNYGTISGVVDLSAWTNAFNNNDGAVFNMGATVNLGNLGNTLYNYGTVSPGGIGVVEETDLNGSFVNEALSEHRSEGTIVADLDLAGGKADLIDVAGEANLSGKLDLNFTTFTPNLQSLTFLTAGNYINTRDLTLVSNPMVQAHIDYPTNKQAEVTIDGFDFNPQGVVTGNGAGISKSFAAAIDNGSAGLGPLAAGLLSLDSAEEVDEAYNELSPNIYTSNNAGSFHDLGGFTNNLFSCRVADGANYFAAEGQCAWVRADYGQLNRTTDGFGSATSSKDIEGGAQVALGRDFRLDTGVGLISSSSLDDSGASSSGTTLQAGTVLKYVPGPLLLAAAVSGSYGWFDSTRPISIGGFSDTLRGGNGITTLNGQLRASYTFQNGDFYLKPQLDLNAILVRSAELTETGGAASLHIDGSDHAMFSVAPALEVGGQMVLDDDSIFRPYLRAGATVYTNQDSTLEAGFTQANAGTEDFTITSSADKVLWNVSAGIDLLRAEGQTVRAYYDASFGQTTNAQSGGLKLSINY